MRRHDPVLFNEVLERIPEGAKNIMDGTLWHGGHTQAMIQRGHKVVWVDRDTNMIAKCEAFLSDDEKTSLTIVQASYAEMPLVVEQSGIEQFDYILLDIWVNMDHFKEADRGFSIRLDGALDMRYDTSSWESVAAWLERANYQDIYTNLELYSDFSDKMKDIIAKDLVNTKKSTPFLTTHDVREWSKKVWISDKKLAVIFQSRRIHVNKELDQLDSFLTSFPKYIKSGGRCAIISYHSGEDRRVKVAFKALAEQWLWTILTKHVIKPTRQEVKKNKAARSAKMRIFEIT